MKNLNTCIIFACLTAGFAATAQVPATRPIDHYANAGPYAVESFLADWTDARRDRKVPVRVYVPADAQGPRPVIIHSHGLGGSREGYAYLGKHWASHGYLVVHLQHLGSDEAVAREAVSGGGMARLKRSVMDPANIINRPADISFAIDELLRLNRADSRLKDRVDPDRIGVSGHSFGAFTVLAVSGLALPDARGNDRNIADPRVKAAIAMSSPRPRSDDKTRYDRIYGQIRIPVFHMTGTEDDSIVDDKTRPVDRRIPFDHTRNATAYLMVLDGGDHMVFAGRAGLRGERSRDAEFHRLILAGSTAFWNAHLRGDNLARVYLEEGSFARELAKSGTLEMKRPSDN